MHFTRWWDESSKLCSTCSSSTRDEKIGHDAIDARTIYLQYFFYKDCPGTKFHLWSARSWVRASKNTSPLLVLKWSNVMCLFILVAICESVICMEFSLQKYRPRANIKKTAQAGASLGSFGFRLFSLLRLRLLFFYLFHSKLKICHRRKFNNNVMCICM